MKNNAFFKWVSNNVILSCFLGLQFFSLIVGLGWAISLTFKDYFPSKNHQPTIAYLEVITDTALLDLMQSEATVFRDQYPSKIEILVSLTSDEDAAKKIAAGENKVLLLSHSLSKNSATGLSSNTTMLQEEPITLNQDSSKIELTLIQNNPVSKEELAFSKFLKDNGKQTIVFHKRKTEAEQKRVKIG